MEDPIAYLSPNIGVAIAPEIVRKHMIGTKGMNRGEASDALMRKLAPVPSHYVQVCEGLWAEEDVAVALMDQAIDRM